MTPGARPRTLPPPDPRRDDRRRPDPTPDRTAGPTRPGVDRLADVEAPALILTGEWEMPYLRVVAAALAYGIPGAERAVVRGGGHAVHLQEPERFTAELARFLRDAGARSRGGSR